MRNILGQRRATLAGSSHAAEAPGHLGSRTSVVLLSGGLDSTVVAAAQVAAGRHPLALAVNLGQAARREIAAARHVCSELGLEHETIECNVRSLAPLSPLLNRAKGMVTNRSAELPGRNAVLVSIAAVALGPQGGEILIGAAPGDPYYDCQPAFLRAMSTVLTSGSRMVDVRAPLLELDLGDRASVVQMGLRIGAPLSATWSCWRGGRRQCKSCGSCAQRAEAFAGAEFPDPSS